MSMTAEEAEDRLLELADDEIAEGMRRFFKTGPGQYGEGDCFLGIKAAPLRQLAREFRGLSLAEAGKLLDSASHEARMLALLLLVGAFEKGDETSRQAIYDLYLASTARVNNWDLVDASAPAIVGGFLVERDRSPVTRLAGSPSLWERRIAVVATLHFIRRSDFADTLRLAGVLLEDKEDLIHKATGWMLREVGKRDEAVLEGFLAEHCRLMPRTMLRYAIERFPAARQRQYLGGEVQPSRAAIRSTASGESSS
jgi:3-methyladenine DNA glycosylase AlkD